MILENIYNFNDSSVTYSGLFKRGLKPVRTKIGNKLKPDKQSSWVGRVGRVGCEELRAWCSVDIKQDTNHEAWSGKRFFCCLFSRAPSSNVLFKLKNVTQNHRSNSMKATSDACILIHTKRELSAMVLTCKRMAQEKNLSK